MSTRIKIHSNPFERRVQCLTWLDSEWMPVELTEPNSSLCRKEFVTGFLPYTAYRLIQCVYEEYGTDSQAVDVVFEGAPDEFEELATVCALEEFAGRINLSKAPDCLNNARDVLPDIIESFGEIRPIVESISDDDIRKYLGKFDEAANVSVPLCVFGNLSSGKSTFINALIGQELLPSGENPVTSKVFRISRARQSDRGAISLDVDGRRVRLAFDGQGIRRDVDLQGFSWYTELLEELDGLAAKTMIPHMRHTLNFLNYHKPTATDSVSNRIDVEVPFCSFDSWGIDNDFVIFDTPGSNRALDEHDFAVLQDAMESFSNGLPLYVCTRNQLATSDNERLCEEIKQAKAVDERFAFVVINQADVLPLQEGLDERERLEILKQPVPDELNAAGVYFASSVMGLGYKTGGRFDNKGYRLVFEKNERDFSDPASDSYTQLYACNCLPRQIYDRTVRESAQSQSHLFVNSGLYCIEQEIRRFADRYSAYNKCSQIARYLREMTQATLDVLTKSKEDTEAAVVATREQLEAGKALLQGKVDEKSEQMSKDARAVFLAHLDSRLDYSRRNITYDWLCELQEKATDAERRMLFVDRREDERRAAQEAIGKNFLSRMSRAFDKPSLGAFAQAAQGLYGDARAANERRTEVRNLERLADREAADELLAVVRREFEDSVRYLASEMEDVSQSYWRQRAEDARDALRILTMGESVLSANRKDEIVAMIINYEPLSFAVDANDIFAKPEFEQSIKLLGIEVFSSDRLDLYKIMETFNQELAMAADSLRREVNQSHEGSYRMWLDELRRVIKTNIVAYNPNLREYSLEIDAGEREIEELSAKLERIQACFDHVEGLMSWKAGEEHDGH